MMNYRETEILLSPTILNDSIYWYQKYVFKFNKKDRKVSAIVDALEPISFSVIFPLKDFLLNANEVSL